MTDIETSTVHLFRGAPSVRSWSKYKETIKERTLCGILRRQDQEYAPSTENPDEVNCRYCKDLMGV